MGPSSLILSHAQAVIAALLTPALLIVAASSFASSALVRLGRVIDRVRKLAESDGPPPASDECDRHRRRAVLAERAVALYYGAAGVFVLAGLSMAVDLLFADRLVWLPVALTVFGMVVLLFGAIAMLQESRLASLQIRDEIDRLAGRGAVEDPSPS
jgi:hypothetical protein